MDKKLLNGLAGTALVFSSLLVLPACATSAQSVQADYELTQNVRRNAEQARVAITQNNFTAANGYLAQAASQVRTDGDRYILATMQLDVANRTFNRAAQVAAIDTLIQSSIVSETQRADLYYHRGRLAYNAQDTQAARTMLSAAVERGSTNPRSYIALASLQASARDFVGALALIDRAMEIQQTSGTVISDDWYRRAVHIAQQANDPSRIAEANQALVAAYPTVSNWRDALTLYRMTPGLDEDTVLDSWRLQSAAGALTGEGDYLRYAQHARSVGVLPEIERLVLAGRANSMLDGRNAEISALDRGTTAAGTAMRNSVAGRASSAAASAADGSNALAVANDYLTLGQYAEAAPLYRTAIEKGGVDTELANLRLGMSLALSGDAAGARAALDAVTGQRGWIARFWRAYADNLTAAPVQPAAS